MGELQLLNLQHNLITVIQHLSHLQRLVFLNLYDNNISEMTGIESLRSLRILMLGKNRSVVISRFHKQKNARQCQICLNCLYDTDCIVQFIFVVAKQKLQSR